MAEEKEAPKIVSEVPKPAGYSSKAIFAGLGILGLFVFFVIFSLHKKAEQQKIKKPGAASSALNSVVKSVSSQAGNSGAPQPRVVVPDFVDTMSPAKNLESGNTGTSGHGISPQMAEDLKKKVEAAQKTYLASANSSLKMKIDDDETKKKNAAAGVAKKGGGGETSEQMSGLQAMIAKMQKAQDMGDHTNDAQLAELQKEMLTLKAQQATEQNGQGNGQTYSSPIGGGGFGGGIGVPGYGGMGMPTMQATNPNPSQMASMQNKWQSQQEKSTKVQYIKADVQKPESPYYLTAGTIIPAELTREINTSNPGSVSAIVTGNVYNDAPGHENEIIIPAGAKLEGTYNSNVQFGQERVQTVWKQILLPDGRIVPIVGEGADMAGESGLKDKVDNHYLKLFEGVMLMSIFDAGPMLATPSSSTSTLNGGAVESTMGQSVGMNASSVGMEFTSNMLNLAPTITIRDAFPFNIVLPKTVVFNTYYSVLGQEK